MEQARRSHEVEYQNYLNDDERTEMVISITDVVDERTTNTIWSVRYVHQNSSLTIKLCEYVH